MAAGSAVAAIMAEAVRVAGQGRWGRGGAVRVVVGMAAERAGVARAAEGKEAVRVWRG